MGTIQHFVMSEPELYREDTHTHTHTDTHTDTHTERHAHAHVHIPDYVQQQELGNHEYIQGSCIGF